MAQSTDVINGSDFFMYDSHTVIGHATEHDLSITMETLNASNKTVGFNKHIRPGMVSWTAGGSGLYQFDDTYGFSQLFAAITNRTKIMVRLATTEALNKYYYGYGYLTKLDANFPHQENSTYTWAFEGDGALTEATGT